MGRPFRRTVYPEEQQRSAAEARNPPPGAGAHHRRFRPPRGGALSDAHDDALLHGQLAARRSTTPGRASVRREADGAVVNLWLNRARRGWTSRAGFRTRAGSSFKTRDDAPLGAQARLGGPRRDPLPPGRQGRRAGVAGTRMVFERLHGSEQLVVETPATRRRQLTRWSPSAIRSTHTSANEIGVQRTYRDRSEGARHARKTEGDTSYGEGARKWYRLFRREHMRPGQVSTKPPPLRPSGTAGALDGRVNERSETLEARANGASHIGRETRRGSRSAIPVCPACHRMGPYGSYVPNSRLPLLPPTQDLGGEVLVPSGGSVPSPADAKGVPRNHQRRDAHGPHPTAPTERPVPTGRATT